MSFYKNLKSLTCAYSVIMLFTAACFLTCDNSVSDRYGLEVPDEFLKRGTFTDPRNNRTYRTVVMPDGKTWMAENLNFNPGTASGSWCYDNNTTNCNTYGRLYDWATAMWINTSCNTQTLRNCGATVNNPHRGICPEGWHLPTSAEWETMLRAAGGVFQNENFTWQNVGTKLKSSTRWTPHQGISTGTDEFGFGALPGGFRWTDGSFDWIGLHGYWWTATQLSVSEAFNHGIQNDDNGVINYRSEKIVGKSVRCVRDD